MNNHFCNCLYSIALSVIISFIFAICYYFGVFTEITTLIIFTTIFSFISLFIISILGASDNGYTRMILCKNIICLLISIVLNILLGTFSLSIPYSNENIILTIIFTFTIFSFSFNLFSIIFLLYNITNFTN